jgi:AcrR family transcriptional regulator
MQGSHKIVSEIKDRDLLNARRAELVSAATDILIERGYANVSVNEIAKAAGVSIGSLYNYIRRKQDVLWLVMDSIYRQVEDLLLVERSEAANPIDALRHTLARYLSAVYGARGGILLMYQECRNLEKGARKEIMRRETRIMKVFTEIIQDGVASGHFKCSDPELAGLNMLMAAHTLALKGWFLRDLDIADYIKTQTELALAAVGAGQSSLPFWRTPLGDPNSRPGELRSSHIGA